MAAKKLVNVHEALEYLENLDGSLENDLSDDEDFISRGRLAILPPTTRVIETLMNIQEIKMSLSQTI